ncbi:MAG: imelysin family protein, partial [Myxococcales bacterium]|nr:imelysin family protein [Myxococcales bacterium]
MMEGRATQRGRGLGKVAVVAGLVAGLTYACVGASISETSPGTTSGGVPEMAARDVLVSLTDGVIVPTYRDFVAASVALEEATAAHRAAPDEETLAAAQAAFRDAMAVWQRAELMQVGPAGSMMAPGGQGLRALIYSWPLVNPCRIDQKLVDESYGDVDALTAELVNAQGLDALEYLLFFEGADNTCAPQLPINADGQWAALGEAELLARRAAYGAAVADEVATLAERLATTWAPDTGEYAQWLAAPGEAGSPYDDVDAALDEVLRAMFYVDTLLKDAKIAFPAGIAGCTTDTCPEGLESPWAQRSKEHVLSNLEGYRRMFVGGASAQEGVGFDDLLIEVGEDALATRMLADIDAAVAA